MFSEDQHLHSELSKLENVYVYYTYVYYEQQSNHCGDVRSSCKHTIVYA